MIRPHGPARGAIEGPIRWVEQWLQERLASGGAGPLLLFGIRLVALLLLVGVAAWVSAPLCRWLGRRARRLGQETLAQLFLASAPTVRLVVLLGGLTGIADWALATEGSSRSVLASALFVLTVLLATAGLIRVARVLLERFLRRLVGLERRLDAFDVGAAAPVPGNAEALVPLSNKIAAAVLWLCALVVVLDHFGQSVSSVVAALGVGSLAIGLAAQQALSNMIAGLVLLMDRPFRVGDRIRLPGLEIGRVEDLGMRSTRIRLSDGNLLIVPNNELVASKVVNYTGAAVQHGEVRFSVPAGFDLAARGAALAELAAQTPGILADPAPRLVLLSIGERLELALSFRLDPAADAPAVEEALRRQVLQRLQQGPLAPPNS